MLDFRTCGIQRPVKFQLDVLDQVACEFDVANVCWVILGADVVVLQYSGRVEVVDKGITRFMRCVSRIFDWIIKNWILEIFLGVEVLINRVDLRNIANIRGQSGLLVGIADGTKAFPKTLVNCQL